VWTGSDDDSANEDRKAEEARCCPRTCAGEAGWAWAGPKRPAGAAPRGPRYEAGGSPARYISKEALFASGAVLREGRLLPGIPELRSPFNRPRTNARASRIRFRYHARNSTSQREETRMRTGAPVAGRHRRIGGDGGGG
jgi:hypothetical protein